MKIQRLEEQLKKSQQQLKKKEKEIQKKDKELDERDNTIKDLKKKTKKQVAEAAKTQFQTVLDNKNKTIRSLRQQNKRQSDRLGALNQMAYGIRDPQACSRVTIWRDSEYLKLQRQKWGHTRARNGILKLYKHDIRFADCIIGVHNQYISGVLQDSIDEYQKLV